LLTPKVQTIPVTGILQTGNIFFMQQKQLKHSGAIYPESEPGTTVGQHVLGLGLAQAVREEVEKQLSFSPSFWVACVSVKECAALLKVTPDTIRTYITTGKLAASQEGKNYFIKIADVNKFLTKRSNVLTVVKK
jgi:excisionase family DNA binding protein